MSVLSIFYKLLFLYKSVLNYFLTAAPLYYERLLHTHTPTLKKWMEKVIKKPNTILRNVAYSIWTSSIQLMVCALNNCLSAWSACSQSRIEFCQKFLHSEKQHSAYGVHNKHLFLSLHFLILSQLLLHFAILSCFLVLFLILSQLLVLFLILSHLLEHSLYFKLTFSAFSTLSHSFST